MPVGRKATSPKACGTIVGGVKQKTLHANLSFFHFLEFLILGISVFKDTAIVDGGCPYRQGFKERRRKAETPGILQQSPLQIYCYEDWEKKNRSDVRIACPASANWAWAVTAPLTCMFFHFLSFLVFFDDLFFLINDFLAKKPQNLVRLTISLR